MGRSDALEALRGPLYAQPWVPKGESVSWLENPSGAALVGDSDGRVYARILGSACGDWTVYFSGFEFSCDGPLIKVQRLVQAIFEGETIAL